MVAKIVAEQCKEIGRYLYENSHVMSCNVILISFLHKLLNDNRQTLCLLDEKMDICLQGLQLYIDDLKEKIINLQKRQLLIL